MWSVPHVQFKEWVMVMNEGIRLSGVHICYALEILIYIALWIPIYNAVGIPIYTFSKYPHLYVIPIYMCSRVHHLHMLKGSHLFMP